MRQCASTGNYTKCAACAIFCTLCSVKIPPLKFLKLKGDDRQQRMQLTASHTDLCTKPASNHRTGRLLLCQGFSNIVMKRLYYRISRVPQIYKCLPVVQPLTVAVLGGDMYTWERKNVCMCVCVCMHACMCVCMCMKLLFFKSSLAFISWQGSSRFQPYLISTSICSRIQ